MKLTEKQAATVEKLKNIPVPSVDELEAATRPLTLADAIRAGSTVTEQAYGWGDGQSACALSAAALYAKAHGFL